MAIKSLLTSYILLNGLKFLGFLKIASCVKSESYKFANLCVCKIW